MRILKPDRKSREIGQLARNLYAAAIIPALLWALGAATGGHIGVMGGTITACLLVALLAATEPESDARP
jgi:hypothetical protein